MGQNVNYSSSTAWSDESSGKMDYWLAIHTIIFSGSSFFTSSVSVDSIIRRRFPAHAGHDWKQLLLACQKVFAGMGRFVVHSMGLLMPHNTSQIWCKVTGINYKSLLEVFWGGGVAHDVSCRSRAPLECLVHPPGKLLQYHNCNLHNGFFIDASGTNPHR